MYGKLGMNFILGIAAIILGVLGLKDFFSYKPKNWNRDAPISKTKSNKLIQKLHHLLQLL